MTVKMIETGEIVAVNDSYGVRLVEQGKAVCQTVKQPKKSAKKAEENVAE